MSKKRKKELSFLEEMQEVVATLDTNLKKRNMSMELVVDFPNRKKKRKKITLFSRLLLGIIKLKGGQLDMKFYKHNNN